MSTNHYLPRPDAAFDRWQANYIDYALAHSPDLGLTHAEVEALEIAQAAWIKGYTAIPEARATLDAALEKKNDARGRFEAVLRSVSARIQANPAVSNAQRAALGLTVPSATRTPVDAPGTRPVLAIDIGQRLVHRIRFCDSATPLRRAKPHGVISLELRQCLVPAGHTPPTDPAAYTFLTLATRSPFAINLPAHAAGQTAAYTARWINTKAEPGPWSDIATATVGG